MFARYEWMIAWRYLRARRSEGGISVMTWISLVGIALAVFALIATLAVRSGFRYEFVDTIVGANPHVSVLSYGETLLNGDLTRTVRDYDTLAERLSQVPDVTSAMPVVEGQVLASAQGRNAGVQVTGIRPDDLRRVPRVANPEESQGSLDDFDGGIAIGAGVARELGVGAGDTLRLISPDGQVTPMGRSPRTKAYRVGYVFKVGRYDIDGVRVYMPFDEAQTYFNREGVADEIQLTVTDPEAVDAMAPALMAAAGDGTYLWTWKDSAGAFLQALTMEDNIMFVILSILVLIATLNITSGLVMLVKNKGRDIGILRTMGMTEGTILRIFFICGASIGVIGTAIGVVLGCAFAIWIDPVFNFVNYLAGGGVWDESVRYISQLPARLELGDVLSAVGLSLALSFVVTIFPARRAARMNPVEALRYE
ncbi:lipoprotein-releasing ABC transporter permease subunit [Jannaschia rubra]|uniref:Lipoprotein-releasing system transmembrane protein LolC n=1 Tax=Jannaschia rubra TaxID=282197 RepID=A0A0M6XMF4_9RHOB|nr:lipoprotein-releasing ABC transporter permease subunit [Jannaschia rubra]CTQ32370.1 Lipoprotein-releasing system transmembrane protein LolC [Jannaschia rubra]SFG46010.1 lipoprotein-releasing system permease protein [Jannaschia rubra]